MAELSQVESPRPRSAHFFLGVLPWTARNYFAFGQLVPIKSTFGLEFWLGNNPEVKRNWSPGNHPNNDGEQMRQLVHFGEMSYMKAKQRQAVLFMEAHPATFAKFCLGRLADTWTGNADVPWDRFVFMLHAGEAYLIFSSAFSVLALAGRCWPVVFAALKRRRFGSLCLCSQRPITSHTPACDTVTRLIPCSRCWPPTR